MLIWLLNAPAVTQRAIAVGFAVSAAALVLWAVSAIAGNLSEQQRVLLETRERAGRLIKFAATDLSQVNPSPAGAPGPSELFMNALSIAIARAELQQRVNQIAGAHSSFVASIGNLPNIEQNATTFIGLRVDFSGRYDDVMKTILAIETGMPPLIIKEFNIRSAGPVQADMAPRLAARVHVFSAVRTGDGSEDAEGAGQ